ncbi:MAG: ATP-binding protein [Bacilli bacterium]
MKKSEIYFEVISNDPMYTEGWVKYTESLLREGDLKKGLENIVDCLGKGMAAETFLPMLQQVFSLSEVESSIEESNVLTTNSEEMTGITIVDSLPTEERSKVLVQGALTNNVVSIDTYKSDVITFKDVGGLDDVKMSIRMKIIEPFSNKSVFAKFKKKVGGGILLYGPPGCGKTFIAKATAGECRAEFFHVNIADILDPYIGQSEQNLQNIFNTARKHKPAILFFDEIDTLAYSRSRTTGNNFRGIVDTFLTEMDSLSTNTDQLLIIGATNTPWDVDSAFKRPGRFDKTMFVPPPDEAARRIILQLKMKDKPISENINLEALVQKTVFFSGADLDNLIETATERTLMNILETGIEREIEQKDFDFALRMCIPSTTSWLSTLKNYVKFANSDNMYDEAAHYLNGTKY